MKKYISVFLLTSLLILDSCQQSSTIELPIEITVDGEEIKLNDNNQLRIIYVKGGDTTSLESKEHSFHIPRYDTSITYFQIGINEYELAFSGEFLSYELPYILDAKNEFWYLDIDNPPLENGRTDFPENMNYLIGLYYDSARRYGAWEPVLTE